MITANIKGVDLRFETSPGVFSPNAVDKGTLAMLSKVEFAEDDKVLDLGCGYGVVGILAARIAGPERVTMVDADEEAVRLARENAALNLVRGIKIIQSNAFENVDEKDYTLILCNPPYHADFSVPKTFIEKGFNRLAVGGRMFVVTKRKEWYKNKLVSIFGGVRIWESGGYFVFMSVKQSEIYARAKKG